MSYDPGDWTSYRDFRYARCLDAGAHELFVATSAGVQEYNLFSRSWNDPMVVGFGLSEAVEFDDPMLLLYDEQVGNVWVVTRSQLLVYDVDGARWRRVHRNLWGPGDRVINLGVGANDIYLETVPAAFFSSFFLLGSPIPNNRWRGMVTRYKGSRTFGGLQMELDPQEDPNIRWRGFRSKVPLTSQQLFGGIGAPPANFPSILLNDGWQWHLDGTLMDPYLRAMPITDWLVDKFGNLWTTFWGGGIIKTDLRTYFPQFFSTGPAGNDIRALYVGIDDLWMGGFNSGDRLGITWADPALKDWKFFERRDNTRIRSTDLYDIAVWDGAAWFATEEGLLAFQKKGEEWSLFTVSENLQSNQLRALAVKDNELWIGNSNGLCVMKSPGREIWRVPNDGIELAGVTDLAICEDTLFVGTGHGLFKGSVRNHAMKFTPLDPGLLTAPVLDISVWRSEIWLVTSEGIQVYNQSSGISKSWRAQDWMSGSEPSCICAMDSFIWVGTRANGFYRYRRSTGEWISYTTADGLVDNRVQIIRPDGDDLLIGTANGLTRFYWNRPGRLR
ncbi:hypothetical protein EHM69_02735 [candidate division KSB1 bacterium]|nr:MAG: hypothetical protein EHM69_02735 [candidate division KSB1 bacterium]